MTAKKTSWSKSKVPNLYRKLPSEVYYSRIWRAGKRGWKSLGTSKFSVAKIRHKRMMLEESSKSTEAEDSMAWVRATWLRRIRQNQSLKESTRKFWTEALSTFEQSWPELSDKRPSEVTERECEDWSEKISKTLGASRYNHTIMILRQFFEIAHESALVSSNPAKNIRRKRVAQKELTLPSTEEFHELVESIRNRGHYSSKHGAELVEFLAYSGMRISEAGQVKWKDIDLKKGEIYVRGNEKTGTKNWSGRHIPIVKAMRSLIERASEEEDRVKANQPFLRAFQIRTPLTEACDTLNIPRITHHDLRHYFATTCIESDVDIPTLARWLGHQDGGVLAMKTYGHLRNEHSQRSAEKVQF